MSTRYSRPGRGLLRVLCEDLAINGVLATGRPLALSTWIGRTGLSEMPPFTGTINWRAWGRRVRLDRAQLRPYARAVFASTHAYIAALPNEAFDSARHDRPAHLLSALLLTLSMRRGEIACLLALESEPTTAHEEAMITQTFGEADRGSPQGQLRLLLGGIFVVFAAGSLAMVVLSSVRVKSLLPRHPGYESLSRLDYRSVFIGFGARLALERQ